MSLHECPRCGHETATNSTTAGAFEVPPTLYCVHGEEAVEMKVVSEADLLEEAMVEAFARARRARDPPDGECPICGELVPAATIVKHICDEHGD